jgi:hypothetical protein
VRVRTPRSIEVYSRRALWRERQPQILRRFEEPLHVFESSLSDVVRPRSDCEVRLLQEVDTGSSAETTVNARLIQFSAHEKNRCVLFH